MDPHDGTAAWLFCRLSVALVVALAFAPLIREITTSLGSSVGERWPFVMEHCRSLDTPGCRSAEPGPLLRRFATR